jgi:hypothetical protein
LRWYAQKYSSVIKAGEQPFQASWAEFRKEILKAFVIPNKPFYLRQKLRRTKQRESLQEYILKFRIIIMEIGEMYEAERVICFIDGLKPNIQTQLLREPPENLELAIRKATNFQLADNAKLFFGSNDEKERVQRKCVECGKTNHYTQQCYRRACKKNYERKSK